MSKSACTSSCPSSSSRKETEGMDSGDGNRTDELYERSVVEAHAFTLDTGGWKEVEA